MNTRNATWATLAMVVALAAFGLVAVGAGADPQLSRADVTEPA